LEQLRFARATVLLVLPKTLKSYLVELHDLPRRTKRPVNNATDSETSLKSIYLKEEHMKTPH